MAKAAARLAPVAGLVHGRLDSGAATILWAAAADAPIDAAQDDIGAAVVFGDALAPGETGRTGASALRTAWMGPQPTRAAYDGFFAAIALHRDAVVVGTDLLGLFPLYTAERDACFIASSTPAAFYWHPRFDGGLHVAGLLGYLLTGGSFGGDTLLQGVRRLDAGVRLRWQASTGGVAERVFSWPSGGADSTLSFDAHLERLDAAQDAAVRRHTAVHPRLSVLLSGGRDSRTLVGCLARTGREASAITLGAHTDHDATCAAAVARTLKLPHAVHDVAFEQFPEFADRAVVHERLASGMSSIHSWAGADALRATGGAVLSGYVFEIRQISPLPDSRDGMLAWTHAHALAPHALQALVRSQYRATVDDVMHAVRTRFTEFAVDVPDPAEASWRWLMAGYARFHSGQVPWRLSFSAWPVLPILDHELLQVMCSIPREFLSSRRMQDALLRKKFPALARLPLDRNADDLRPLLGRPWSRALAALHARMPKRAAPAGAIERRYYARMYDFDNPGWRLVRARAESGRTAASEWFEPAALAALVPPPDHAAAHADPIAQGFAPKSLTGLMRLLSMRSDGEA
ncbi:MAG TPA: asparagine synthase-related protein [Gemmatimonas sp.]|nr:asparagine synthase-related protein [Gemmatimonas sp.]